MPERHTEPFVSGEGVQNLEYREAIETCVNR